MDATPTTKPKATKVLGKHLTPGTRISLYCVERTVAAVEDAGRGWWKVVCTDGETHTGGPGSKYPVIGEA